MLNDSQSDVQNKKSHKSKRKHDHNGILHSQKHCKYQKVDCDSAAAVEMSSQQECHNECTSEKHYSNKILLVQSDIVPNVQSNIDIHQNEHKKKKKKKLFTSASDDRGTSLNSNADCKELHKSNKKKRQIAVSGDAALNAGEDSWTVLVDKPEYISPSFDADRKQLCRLKKKNRFKETRCTEGGMSSSCDAEYKSLHKHKKKKKSKKGRYTEVIEPMSNLSQDLLKRSSQLQVSCSDDTVCGGAALKTSEDSQTVLELEGSISPSNSTECKRLRKHKKKKFKETKCTKDVELHHDLSQDLLKHSFSQLQVSCDGDTVSRSAALKASENSQTVLVKELEDDISSSCSTKCKRLYTHKKRNRSKETQCEEEVKPNSSLSQELLKVQSFAQSQAIRTDMVCADDTASASTLLKASECNRTLLVNELEHMSPSYDADCEQPHKRKRKKKLKERRGSADVEAPSDISQNMQQSLSLSQVSSADIFCDNMLPGSAALNASEGSQTMLINEAADMSPSYVASGKQLHKHKKKKRFKETRYEDVEPHSDAVLTTGEESSSLLVTKLEKVSADETKYVEAVYNEHKSSKSKCKQWKSNMHVKADIADSHSAALSEVSPDVCSEATSCAPAVTSATDQSLNPADVLEVLHAESHLTYLISQSELREAGEKI